MGEALDGVMRASAGRIIASLAARFRDLDLAEEAFADACEMAARKWASGGEPEDPPAWLYQVARRRALDELRRRSVRERLTPDEPDPHPTPEDIAIDDARIIPDERLRLIFVCCHPAISSDARAALTLRLVCGLSAQEIADAFLISEPALVQRLTRAKRKIGAAGVSFEIPGPAAWPERLEAVLSTLEIAYAKAHAVAVGANAHAGYAVEILSLTEALAAMLPDQGEVLGLAALVRYAEARRPARLDADGSMVPLSEQDPALWRRALIEDGNVYLHRARNAGAFGPRAMTAAIHGLWCSRRSLADPPPWASVLKLHDALLRQRDDGIVRLNRAVALAEVEGPLAALAEVDGLAAGRLKSFQPWHAVRADLLRRLGRADESRAAYAQAIALAGGSAERLWLERQRASVSDGRDLPFLALA